MKWHGLDQPIPRGAESPVGQEGAQSVLKPKISCEFVIISFIHQQNTHVQ